MNLGDNIKYLRKQKGLTQAKMAEKLNEDLSDTVTFNKGKISKWENNKETPHLSSVQVLADFFEVTIDDLVNHDFTSSIYTIYEDLDSSRQEKVFHFAQYQLDEQMNGI